MNPNRPWHVALALIAAVAVVSIGQGFVRSWLG